MVRYFRQYDAYSCGPLALMNAHKWAGFDVRKKDFETYQKMLFSGTTGTSYITFAEKVKENLIAKVDKNPTISKIGKALTDGKIVIVHEHVGFNNHGHYYLITKRHGDGWYRVVNFYSKDAPVEISIDRKVLRHSLRKRNKKNKNASSHFKFLTERYKPYPTVWYVSGPKD